MTEEFPEESMIDLAQWVSWFSMSWRKDEPPQKMHSSKLADDGTKEWHPDFAKYMNIDQRKTRTRKVMRRLRHSNVRAYEVCYRVCVLSERIEDTTLWLNGRALKNQIGYPAHRPDGPHYTRKDTLAILMAGLAYAKQYW